MNKSFKALSLVMLGCMSNFAMADLATLGVPGSMLLNGRIVIPSYGDKTSMGNGYFRTMEIRNADGSPAILGIEFPASTLVDLPTAPNDGLNCWDLNADNAVDLHDECSGGHNRILSFAKNNPTPFKWISIDWEPHGHVPADTYGAKHFDFHFYMMDLVERNKIAVGPCMPGTINCAQREIAIKPVPAKYLHPDFFNTNLAFSRMGNHWADKTSPEFNGGIFTQTFILGSYDSHLSFYEPMVSLAFLQQKKSTCYPIKQPALFEVAGNYPTSYCIRYDARASTYYVYLEKFVRRLAN